MNIIKSNSNLSDSQKTIVKTPYYKEMVECVKEIHKVIKQICDDFITVNHVYGAVSWDQGKNWLKFERFDKKNKELEKYVELTRVFSVKIFKINRVDLRAYVDVKSKYYNEKILHYWNLSIEHNIQSIYDFSGYYHQKGTKLTRKDYDKIKRDQKLVDLSLTEAECVFTLYHFEFFLDLKSNPNLIKDEDIICLKHGKIVKIIDGKEAQKSKETLRFILSETFGEKLTAAAFGRCMLKKKPTITFLDLKKLMVCISMFVKESDLKDLFEVIQNDKSLGDLSSYKAGNILFEICKLKGNNIYEDIKKKKSFDELTPEEICYLHNAFASVLNIINLEDEVSKSKDDYLYTHDLKFLMQMEFWQNLDFNYPELALGEYMGKGLGYTEFCDGMIIKIPEVIKGTVGSSKSPYFYKIHSSLPEKKDAVIAHLLVPLNSKQNPIEKDIKKDHAFLIFRGTNIDSDAKDGGESVLRDMGSEGIGKTSYEKREKDIQSMIENYLDKAKDTVILHIAGHSLGGCDTQRALVSLLEKVAAASSKSSWKKLKKILVTTFNAPKPERDVNERFKKVIKTIDDQQIQIEVDLKHVRFEDLRYEDFLETQGEILLGADKDGTKDTPLKEAVGFLNREIVKVKIQVDPGISPINGGLARHQYRPFTNKHPTMFKLKYDIRCLSSKDEKDRKEMEEYMTQYFHYDPDAGYLQRAISTTKYLVQDRSNISKSKFLKVANIPCKTGTGAYRWSNQNSYETLEERRASVRQY